MADEKPEEGAAEDGAPKSKFKLIVAGVAVFAILAGGVTYYMLFMRAKPDEKQLAEAAAAKPHSFLDVPDMLVNLAGLPGERVQYLKVKIALEFKEEKAIEQAKPALPRVVDVFQGYLRELRSSDLSGSVGFFRLKEELTRRVNTVLQPNKVEAVLFKEIVVQ